MIKANFDTMYPAFHAARQMAKNVFYLALAGLAVFVIFAGRAAYVADQRTPRDITCYAGGQLLVREKGIEVTNDARYPLTYRSVATGQRMEISQNAVCSVAVGKR